MNLLVETVVLNYMALHGEQGNFPTLFPGNGLGSSTLRDSLTAFAPIVDAASFRRSLLASCSTSNRGSCERSPFLHVHGARCRAFPTLHPKP